MKKYFTLATIFIASYFLLISYSSAEVSAVGAQQGLKTLAGLINTFNNTVVKALATLFISAGVVAFFFGITKFIWGLREGKADAVTAGKQFMIWSLVGLFVMFSGYGIIKFFQGIVPGLDDTNIVIPQFRLDGNGLGTPAPGANPVTGLGTPAPGASSALKAIGEQCSVGTQCGSGYCQMGQYGGQCAAAYSNEGRNSQPVEVNNPNYSNEGRNMPAHGANSVLKTIGEQCSVGTQCTSGYCAMGSYGGQCAAGGENNIGGGVR